MMNNGHDIVNGLCWKPAALLKEEAIEKCIQALEICADYNDIDGYMYYRERYKELIGVYPFERKDDNNEN